MLDDEASVRHATGAILDCWGCTTRLAADADHALLATRDRQPDLIVADLRLREGASGLDAIDAVRPWAVDASSSLEVSPGVKNHDRVRAYVEAAR